jgi:hypothetical protein
MIPGAAAKRKALSLRNARIVWFCFLVYGCGIVCAAQVLHHPPPQNALTSLDWILAGIAAADIAVLGLIRRNLLEKSVEQAGRDDTVSARKLWSLAQMLGYSASTSVVLFGLVVAIANRAPAWFAAIFYIVGLATLVLWRPRLSLPPSQPAG